MLDDSKYWELKSQLQYVTTIFPIIIGVVGFFGYDYFDKVRTVQHDMEAKFTSLDSSYKSLKKGVATEGGNIEFIHKRASTVEEKFQQLESGMQRLNNKDIIAQPIYVVSDLKYNPDVYNRRYYFSTMNTISGQPLPIFRKSPLVLVLSNNGMQGVATKVDKSGFQLDFTSFLMEDDKASKSIEIPFSVLIFEQP